MVGSTSMGKWRRLDITYEEKMNSLDLLESLEKASCNQIDTKTFMRAIMQATHEWNRRPIRRIINFLKRISYL